MSMEKLDLQIKCKRLINLHLLHTPSYAVTVSQFEPSTKKFKLVGQTIPVKSDSPTFPSLVTVEYNFSQDILLQFDAYSVLKTGKKLSPEEHVGSARIRLADIVHSEVTATLQAKFFDHVAHNNSQLSPSKIQVRALPYTKSDGTAIFNVQGTNLSKMDFNGSDPFFQIYKNVNDRWVKVYQSSVVKKNCNPSWAKIKIDTKLLCDNDYERPLLFKCYDYDRFTSNDHIGQFKFTLSELTDQNLAYDLRKNKLSKKSEGKIEFLNFRISKKYSLLDYLHNGLCFNSLIAIDFSAGRNSSGRAKNAQIHYEPQMAANEYETAIRAMSHVMESYDIDKMFSVWGFGAVMGNTQSDCFTLTFNQSVPEVRGIEGCIQCYKSCLNIVSLGESKNLAELVESAKILVERKMTKDYSRLNYWIVFVYICDGKISDWNDVGRKLVETQKLPLSFIFVGVGDGTFSELKYLDDGYISLSQKFNKEALRDNVHFVNYRKIASNVPVNLIPNKICEEAYKKIQTQVLLYFKANKIRPDVICSNQSGKSVDEYECYSKDKLPSKNVSEVVMDDNNKIEFVGGGSHLNYHK